jgi:hypothetical protein
MRALKIATIVMGAFIVFGTTTLIIVVVHRMAAPLPNVAAPAVAAVVLDEPAGTRVAGIAAVQDRLAIQLAGGGVDRVVLIDPATGAMAGRISLAR